jgi:hypothetical protein
MNFNDEFMKLHIPLLTYLSKLSPEEYNSMAEAFDIASLNEFENFFEPRYFNYEKFYPNLDKENKMDEPCYYRLKGMFTNGAYNFDGAFEWKNIQGFGSLLNLIMQNLGNAYLFEGYQLKSTLFSHRIKSVNMGNLIVYSERDKRRGGNKSMQKKTLEPYLPKGLTVIIPSLQDKKTNSKYLRIPSQIVRAFNISKDDKYYLGLTGTNTDSLYLFPKKNAKGSVFCRTLDTSHFSDIEHNTNFCIANLTIADLFIWHKEIEIYYNKNNFTYDLKIPKPFLEKTYAESLFRETPSALDASSVFILRFDMLGNLVFHRVLIIDQAHHKNADMQAVLVADLPDEVDDLSSIATDNLSFYSVINDLIDEQEP